MAEKLVHNLIRFSTRFSSSNFSSSNFGDTAPREARTWDSIVNLSWNKPQMLLFFANWCGHCKNMKPAWESAKEECRAAIWHSIECDEEPDLVRQSQVEVRGYPTIVLLKNNKVIPYSSNERDMASLVRFASTAGGS